MPISQRRRLAVLLLLACASASAAAQAIAIGGNGSGLGTMRLLGIESARTGGPAVVIVPNLGSTGGLQALQARALDLAVSSRELTPQEKAAGLVATEYGRTPFVVATADRRRYPVGSLQELAELYDGRRLYWPDGVPVRLVLRPRDNNDHRLLAAFSPQVKAALDVAASRRGMIVVATHQASADALEQVPGAIGAIALASILSERRALHPAALDGVQPTPANLANGSYPHAKRMYIVRRADAPADVLRLLDLLASPRGRRILEDNGHWVPREQR